ncbi:MAG: hypothetical protein WC911_03580 [Thermoleophilia bacterium]
MTALAADVNRQSRSGDIVARPMDGAPQTIYKGALVMNDATGYAVEGADTASCIFLGVSREAKTIAATETDGTTKIRTERRGLHRFAFGAGNAAVTSVGTVVCITDDNTVNVALTTTNDIPCGKIAIVESATVVWIDIEGYCA